MLSASVSAQEITGRVTMEAVASMSVTSDTADDPFLIFDAVSTIRLGRGWDGVVRPWARRMPGGDWGAEMYQLQVRYTSSTHIPFRFDAGIISSPMGLATLELRPDRNPTIGAPFYYFVPLPAMDGRFDASDDVGGISAGALISASGPRWDVRGGVTDDTPARGRSVNSSASWVAATPQFIAGGGMTPVAGLRIGVGFARGRVPRRRARLDGERQRARRARKSLQRRRRVHDPLYAHFRRVGAERVRHHRRPRIRDRILPAGCPDAHATVVRVGALDGCPRARGRAGSLATARADGLRDRHRPSSVARLDAAHRMVRAARLHRDDHESSDRRVARLGTAMVMTGSARRQPLVREPRADGCRVKPIVLVRAAIPACARTRRGDSVMARATTGRHR